MAGRWCHRRAEERGFRRTQPARIDARLLAQRSERAFPRLLTPVGSCSCSRWRELALFFFSLLLFYPLFLPIFFFLFHLSTVPCQNRT